MTIATFLSVKRPPLLSKNKERVNERERDRLRCEKRVSEKIADETTAIIGRRSVELQSGFIPLHDGSKIEEALL